MVDRHSQGAGRVLQAALKGGPVLALEEHCHNDAEEQDRNHCSKHQARQVKPNGPRSPHGQPRQTLARAM
jgi:hypothetical protein